MSASAYRPTIGLEIHAELKTKTKMFCGCLNNPNETEPNKNICPVCMAHPGTLPVINREAVYKVLQVGTALQGQLADFTEFDRKNYFYPDIPKGYQISQYKYPLVSGGTLNDVLITRIHLEEDTGSSQHEASKSLVDFNRAGVPLMELVTEPVIHSGSEAAQFARELQLLLQYLRVSDANMEKGEMRVEANISVSQNDALGTKVEIKNLNSFRSAERAISYEITRQSALLEEGGTVMQETRGWDEAKQITFSQRKKESSHDYRYFPDPDLPKLTLSSFEEFSKEHLSRALGELPQARRARYRGLNLKEEDADLLVREPMLGTFFDTVIHQRSSVAALAANYLTSDFIGKKQKGEVSDVWLSDNNAIRFATLMHMIDEGRISSRGAKDLLALMFIHPEEPEALAEKNNLLQRSDDTFLVQIIQEVIAQHPDQVGEYKAGKNSVLQFFMGESMKKSKGAANPNTLKGLIEEALR